EPDIDPPQRAIARRRDPAVLDGMSDDHPRCTERSQRAREGWAIDRILSVRARPHRAVIRGERRRWLIGAAGLAVEPAPRALIHRIDLHRPVAEHAGVREPRVP